MRASRILLNAPAAEASAHDMMDEMREAEQLAAALRSRLPPRIDGRDLSPVVKIPYHAALVDIGLSYRAAELADAALDLIGSHRTVSALMLARGALETAAVHFYASKHVLDAVASNDIQECTNVLFRALTGSKVYSSAATPPIQVLTALGHVDKHFEGARSFYDQQSEIAHPNWWGSHGAYAGENETEDSIEFHPDHPRIGGIEVARGIAMALTVLEFSHQRLGRAMPAFIEVCEVWWKEHGA